MPTPVKSTRWAVAVALGLVSSVVFAVAVHVLAQSRAQGAAVPVYKIDPFWPKPLPNKWIIQGVPTMVTDKDDHIWVLHRPRDIAPDESGAASTPPRTDCCVAARAVLEFDTAGNLLKAWGGPGHHPDWPAAGIERPGAAAEHAIVVDRDGNVWISGNAEALARLGARPGQNHRTRAWVLAQRAFS